jgi:hypothetical protein
MTKLTKEWTDYCVGQPETGMGYQAAHITVKGGKRISATILNCEYIQSTEAIEPNDIIAISIGSRMPGTTQVYFEDELPNE